MYNNNLQTKPRKWEAKPLFTIHYQLLTIHAFTLIELLVVMTIMVMLVAISVPMLKPMFESQKTKNAAQTVAAALQRVRFKAMEEQATCGIQFVPFETNNNVALKMRLVKQRNSTINSDPKYRIRILNGQITLYEYTLSPSPYWTPVDQTIWDSEWNNKVDTGYKIQIGRQGRQYTLGTAKATVVGTTVTVHPTLQSPYDQLTFPDNQNDAMEFLIIQPPRSTLTPPVVLPRGTVIDLPFSGGYAGSSNYQRIDQIGYNVMFTPNGDVEYFYGNYTALYGGLIYFCIGEWDRQSDTGMTLAEDGKNNIETMTNFWVTLHPRTGAVRITEMAPAANNNDVQGARKFAAEYFGISE